MQALIVADRYHDELSALNDKTCCSMLPIAARPLIEYALDLLVGTQVEKVYIAVSYFAEHVASCLGDGNAWGLSLEYVYTEGDEEINDLLRRIFPVSDEPVVVLEADRLCSRDDGLKLFLEKVAEYPEAERMKALGIEDLGFTWFRSTNPKSLAAQPVDVEIPEVSCSLVDSAYRFHELNLDVAAGQVRTLELHVMETSPGIYEGVHTSIPPSGIREVGVLAGRHCQVDPRSELGPRVSMSNDVLIDRGARLEDCVILDGTYVGADVELRHSIVWGETVVQIEDPDEGETSSLEVIQVDDPSQLVDLRKRPLADFLARTYQAVSSALKRPWTGWINNASDGQQANTLTR